MTDVASPTPHRVVAYAQSADVAGSRDFYTDVLGFTVAMTDPVLGLHSPADAGAQILLAGEGDDARDPRFGVDLGTPDAVDAAHAAAVQRGLRVVYQLTDEPWGVRRFFVEDPSGTIVNVLAHRDR